MAVLNQNDSDKAWNTISPAYQGWEKGAALRDFFQSRGGNTLNLPGTYGDQLRQSDPSWVAEQTANRNKAEQQKLLDTQKSQQSDFLKRYSDTITALPQASDLYSKFSTQLGLPDLQSAATNLESTLAALPQTTLQRSQNFGLSDAQRKELLATESEKLAPEVSSVEGALGARQAEVGTLLSSTLAQQEKQLLPFQAEASFLTGDQQQAFKLLDTNEQNSFNLILEKIKNDQAMSKTEVDQANALALKMQDFTNQVNLYKQFPSLATSSGAANLTSPSGNRIVGVS